MATTRDVLAEGLANVSLCPERPRTEARLSGKPHVFTHDWLNEWALLHVQLVDRVVSIVRRPASAKQP